MKNRSLAMRIVGFLAAVLCCVMAGCSNIKNPAAIPYSNSDFQGMAYEDAISAIREAGFVNIQEKTVNPFIGTPGTVEGVSVNGKYIFSKGQKWENDVPVIVTYFRTEEETQEEPVEAAEESAPEPVAEPEKAVTEGDFKVELDLEVVGEDGKPEFVIRTNLPDETKLLLVLDNNWDYTKEQTVIVKDGEAKSEAFKNDYDLPLTEDYTLVIITLEMEEQSEDVRKVLGERGENLAGDLIYHSDFNGGISYVHFEYEYTSPYTEDEIENQKSQGKASAEEDMRLLLQSAMASGFGNDCYVTLDGDIYYVNVWQDGLAITAVFAQSGIPEAVAAWDTIRQAAIDGNKSLQNLLKNNRFEGYLVVTNVLNDQNKDNILLCVMAGNVISDVAA